MIWQTAAEELRRLAKELCEAHTDSAGNWRDEDEARAEHDRLLAMSYELETWSNLLHAANQMVEREKSQLIDALAGLLLATTGKINARSAGTAIEAAQQTLQPYADSEDEDGKALWPLARVALTKETA